MDFFPCTNDPLRAATLAQAVFFRKFIGSELFPLPALIEKIKFLMIIQPLFHSLALFLHLCRIYLKSGNVCKRAFGALFQKSKKFLYPRGGIEKGRADCSSFSKL